MSQAKAPQLSTFHITPRVFQTGVMIAALVYTTFSPAPTSPSYHPAYTVASWVQNALPDGVLKACWIFMVTVHVLESFYTLSLCRKHRTPFLVGVGPFQRVFPNCIAYISNLKVQDARFTKRVLDFTNWTSSLITVRLSLDWLRDRHAGIWLSHLDGNA